MPQIDAEKLSRVVKCANDLLTGVYLVWGVSALPDRPALGLMIGFLTIAIGQAVGASIFGLLMDRLTTNSAVTIFTCLALMPGLTRADNVNALAARIDV